jgi:hypothetical protein
MSPLAVRSVSWRVVRITVRDALFSSVLEHFIGFGHLIRERFGGESALERALADSVSNRVHCHDLNLAPERDVEWRYLLEIL